MLNTSFCLSTIHSGRFSDCQEKIETVKRLIPEELLNQDDDMLLPDEIQKEVSKVKLMLLHIDRGIETGVLVRKDDFQE
ncbi:MAG: hypothetical protein GY801_26280 [bacterium]|nr:hypothetical protein [bacterium]